MKTRKLPSQLKLTPLLEDPLLLLSTTGLQNTREYFTEQVSVQHWNTKVFTISVNCLMKKAYRKASAQTDSITTSMESIVK